MFIVLSAGFFIACVEIDTVIIKVIHLSCR